MAGRFLRVAAALLLFPLMEASAGALPVTGMPPPAQVPASPVPKLAEKAPGWAELTSDQRAVLAPLGPEWDRLPPIQRKRLLAVVKRYPKMTPEQIAEAQQEAKDWRPIPEAWVEKWRTR